MDKNSFSMERFLTVPVVGILRNISFEDIARILPLYHAAGMSAIEITMNTPGAEEIIRYAVSRQPGHLNIGAGTVCSLEDLDRALEAGAQFIVTPLTDEQLITSCVQRGVPIFPGAFTPTEIYKAWTLGADIVKIFPATSLGPKYIRDLKGPLNQVKLMPTGGVSLDNCIDFLKAGATGLGLGSQLFDKDLIREQNWKALADHFEQFVKKIKAYKTDSSEIAAHD